MSASYTDSKGEKHQWGVGCIILDNYYKTLLLQRKDNELWGTPGGGVELGESAIDAVLREVKEESGLDIEYPTYLGSFLNYNEDVVWTSFSFMTSTYKGELKAQPSEVLELKWVHLSDLKDYNLFNASRCGFELLEQQYPELFHPVAPFLAVCKSNKTDILVEICNKLNVELSQSEISGLMHYMDDDDLQQFLQNLDMECNFEELRKMTAIDQMISIKDPGSDGGLGHYNSSGKWVYDKKSKKGKNLALPQNNKPNQINILKQSYIQYFTRSKQYKALYEVKNGQFDFPDYTTAIQKGIVKDKKSYFTLFKEQYILFAIKNKKIIIKSI